MPGGKKAEWFCPSWPQTGRAYRSLIDRAARLTASPVKAFQLVSHSKPQTSPGGIKAGTCYFPPSLTTFGISLNSHVVTRFFSNFATFWGRGRGRRVLCFSLWDNGYDEWEIGQRWRAKNFGHRTMRKIFNGPCATKARLEFPIRQSVIENDSRTAPGRFQDQSRMSGSIPVMGRIISQGVLPIPLHGVCNGVLGNAKVTYNPSALRWLWKSEQPG